MSQPPPSPLSTLHLSPGIQFYDVMKHFVMTEGELNCFWFECLSVNEETRFGEIKYFR